MNISGAKVLTKFVDFFQFHQMNSQNLNGFRHEVIQFFVGGKIALRGGGGGGGGGCGRFPVDGFDKVDDFFVSRFGVRTIRLHRTFLALFEENRQKRK